MTFVLSQQVGECNGFAKARIERELMLQARVRWRSPPMRKTVPVPHALRARLVDLKTRAARETRSCARRTYLRRWHEPHRRFPQALRKWVS